MHWNNEWQNSAFSMQECLFHLYANQSVAGRSEVGNNNDG
jgi:hypothetical protein